MRCAQQLPATCSREGPVVRVCMHVPSKTCRRLWSAGRACVRPQEAWVAGDEGVGQHGHPVPQAGAGLEGEGAVAAMGGTCWRPRDNTWGQPWALKVAWRLMELMLSAWGCGQRAPLIQILQTWPPRGQETDTYWSFSKPLFHSHDPINITTFAAPSALPSCHRMAATQQSAPTH